MGIHSTSRFVAISLRRGSMEITRTFFCSIAFICQGWGPQRRTNGETAARAIALLPQLVGQVGLPSTNSGLRE